MLLASSVPLSLQGTAIGLLRVPHQQFLSPAWEEARGRAIVLTREVAQGVTIGSMAPTDEPSDASQICRLCLGALTCKTVGAPSPR